MVSTKNPSFLFSFVVFCIISSFAGLTYGNPPEEGGTSCKITFNNDGLDAETTSAVVQLCLDKFPMKPMNQSGTEEEKVKIAKENENNCALKCINEQLNVTTSDGLVDTSKIVQHFRDSNATTAYVDHLLTLLKACETETEQKIQSEDIETDKYLCKYHVMFMRCYRDAYLTSRSEINKVCKSLQRTLTNGSVWKGVHKSQKLHFISKSWPERSNGIGNNAYISHPKYSHVVGGVTVTIVQLRHFLIK